jgi:hypothetical protein
MSKGSENPSQTYCGGTDFPDKEIDEQYEKGFAITDITYGDKWVVVTTKSPIGQKLHGSPDFPSDKIQESWDDGYKISCLTYGEGRWIVIMDKV